MRSLLAALVLVFATLAVLPAEAACAPVGRLGNVCVEREPDAICASGSANAVNAEVCQEETGATRVCSSPTTILTGTCQRTDEAAVCTLGSQTNCSFASGVVTCGAHVGWPASGAGCGLPTMNCAQVMWGIHQPGLVVGGSGCSGGVFVDPTQWNWLGPVIDL